MNPNSSLEGITEQINYYCNDLAKELSNIKLFNTTEVAAKINVRIKFILLDISKNLSHDIEKRYDELKAELNRKDITAYQHTKTQLELSDLKRELKEKNRQYHIYQKVTEYDAFRKFIVNKFGGEVMEEWINVQDSYIQMCRDESRMAQEKSDKQNQLTK